MQIDWSVIPRGDVCHTQACVRVSMNRKGEIKMNEFTWRRMGEPKAFLVMYNQPNSMIALKPTAASIKNAFPAHRNGRREARVVRALRLLNEFSIKLRDTIEFKDAEIDQDGQLTLDLRTARVSKRAHSQCRKK